MKINANLTSALIRSLCSLGQPKAVLRTFLVANYANRYIKKTKNGENNEKREDNKLWVNTCSYNHRY